MEQRKECEAVYVTHEDSHVVMSEKVQALAGSIYQEFERMINKYDEEVVKDLMPLVVNVLESLDLSYTENQQHEVEVELLREDNEQLVTQYEREKSLRKTTEQKLFSVEDEAAEERKQLSSKIESLEAVMRMLELKSKNSADHVGRLEEKETELKKEYSKLHDRYTELFKTHMDYLERSKILMGTADPLESMSLSNRLSSTNSLTAMGNHPSQPGADNSVIDRCTDDEISSLHISSTEDPSPLMDDDPLSQALNQGASGAAFRTQENNIVSVERNETRSGQAPEFLTNTSHVNREERKGNTLYQEFSFQDADPSEESSRITGSWVHPGEYASSVNDNFFGMGKEVENLIMENNELLATKNALNIVKDDLIAKVDELTSESEILRKEIHCLESVKRRMSDRVSECEEEMKKMREEIDKLKNATKSDDEDDVPLAQRKRFTRVEMARVLMERNQYKERFMELQEAVRWTEILRAAKHDPALEKRSNRGVLSFFSNLFSNKTTTGSNVALTMTTDRLVSIGGIASASPTKMIMEPNRNLEMSGEKLQMRLLHGTHSNQNRDPNASKIRAYVRKDDGRLQAYGWSLPAKPAIGPSGPGELQKSKPPSNEKALCEGSGSSQRGPVPLSYELRAGMNEDTLPHTTSELGLSTSSKHLPVPVPTYCRPFMESSPSTKIFCACGVGQTGQKDLSHVWVCTSAHSVSRVSIIDANRPAEILQSFDVCTSQLLCITYVPERLESEYNGCDGIMTTGASGNGEAGNVSSEETPNASQSSPSIEQGKNGQLRYLKTNQPILPNDPSAGSTSSPARTADGESRSGDIGEDVRTELKKGGTFWLGAQSGSLYVHSAHKHREVCLYKIKLPDSVLSIVYLKGRCFIGLANGALAIITRKSDEGLWDLENYYLLDLERQPHHSIRCLCVVENNLWCGFRNRIHVVDSLTLSISHCFEAHPRKESQVRQMAFTGNGVWLSIRLDSTLRLYHSSTYEHLQDVDIEPYVSKMLGTGKLGFSYARITALIISCHRLWIGTGNGVIISVPLTETETAKKPCEKPSFFGGPEPSSDVLPVAGKVPGLPLRILPYKDSQGVIPYCSMSQAQLSFHGHRDSVKFFVSVPAEGNIKDNDDDVATGTVESAELTSQSTLVISGGEGYIDFRVAASDDIEGDTATHLIVWKLSSPQHQSSTARFGGSNIPAIS